MFFKQKHEYKLDWFQAYASKSLVKKVAISSQYLSKRNIWLWKARKINITRKEDAVGSGTFYCPNKTCVIFNTIFFSFKAVTYQTQPVQLLVELLQVNYKYAIIVSFKICTLHQSISKKKIMVEMKWQSLQSWQCH